MLFGAIFLLLLVAAYDRDRRSLSAAFWSIPPLLVLAWLGNNPVYVGATLELFSGSWRLFGWVFVLLLALLPLLLWATWRWGVQLVARGERLLPIVYALLFIACAFVVAWATLPNPLRDPDVTRSFQEIIWFSSRYVSPLFYWLALAGVGATFWGRFDRGKLFLAAMFLGLGLVFFFKYSSANVYPVSLRRLIGDIYPLMALLSGSALAAIPWQGPWRFVRVGVAGVALLWIGWLTLPVMQQREADGDVAFVQELHQNLPEDAVLLFEKQDEDSWVGWLAAPLYSVYGDWALLLDSDSPDPELLAHAVASFEEIGRSVYLVSQQDPAPEALVPPGYLAEPVQQHLWQSSLIGQTRAPYPTAFLGICPPGAYL
ncbi:MAG: hypothetical protein HC802_04680 [Caldilineaceae bacterium]|nr:hypothetical protein [Caldilineaceae bacterium]